MPVFRVLEAARSLGRAGPDSADGMPLPPPYLRVLTTGDADAEVFLRLGRAAASAVLTLAREAGADHGPVLEFGVGCGRVARHVVRTRPDLEFHGCDINRRLLSWCRSRLPGRYEVTRVSPPLPYADGAFRLVYALSVFTHLHDDNARAWLAELARVTAPGGAAVLSFHDERLPHAAPIAAELGRVGHAVLYEGEEGSNLLTTYLTAEGFAERAAPHWRLERAVPSDRSNTGQALAVLRRR